jgi:hypothetical protein
MPAELDEDLSLRKDVERRQAIRLYVPLISLLTIGLASEAALH